MDTCIEVAFCDRCYTLTRSLSVRPLWITSVWSRSRFLVLGDAHRSLTMTQLRVLGLGSALVQSRWGCLSQENLTVVQRTCVKCGKFTEGTPGTPDIKSRPMRYWKGLRLQLMCCAPFRLLSQDFRTGRSETGDWKIGVSIRVVLGVELRGRVIKVRTYLIFKLNYLHDISEVFMLSIGINKKINWKTRNKQNP